MEIVNAIARVRFSSARAQRAMLHRGERASAELLCLEPGQELPVKKGRWTYYVIAGSATVVVDGAESPALTGHVIAAEPGEAHTLANRQEQRLICLAVGDKT